jgi:hypothetical protein
MSDEHTRQEPEELSEDDLERQEAEALPDREAMSLITPNVTNPGFTLPVEPTE